MPAYECLYKTNTIIEKKINGWVGPDGEGIAANKCPAYMETPSTLFETHLMKSLLIQTSVWINL